MTWETLDAIRDHLGYNKTIWASVLGITPGTYTNWKYNTAWTAHGAVAMIARMHEAGIVTIGDMKDVGIL